jgi:hypothetical protein
MSGGIQDRRPKKAGDWFMAGYWWGFALLMAFALIVLVIVAAKS